MPPTNTKAQINPGLSLSLDEKWGSRHDPSASSSDYLNIALAISLLLIIAVALLPPREADRFGARSGWKDVLAPLRLPVLLLSSVIATTAALAIYAGFFQDGVWVRRGEIEFDYGAPANIGEGAVLASCGGAKGVSAVSQQDRESGFVRDAVPGSWSVIRHPDGTFDIQTSGKSGSISYRQDGFAIDVPGLRLTEFGRVAPDMEGFQVIGRGQDDAGDVRTVVTMSFVKRGYQYQAVIASSRLIGKNSMLTALSGGHPRASTFLMIADCIVY